MPSGLIAVDIAAFALLALVIWWAAKARRKRRQELSRQVPKWVQAQRQEGRDWEDILALGPRWFTTKAGEGRFVYNLVRRAWMAENAQAAEDADRLGRMRHWIDTQRQEGRGWDQITLDLPAEFGDDADEFKVVCHVIQQAEPPRIFRCSSCGAKHSTKRDLPEGWLCHQCRRAARQR